MSTIKVHQSNVRILFVSDVVCFGHGQTRQISCIEVIMIYTISIKRFLLQLFLKIFLCIDIVIFIYFCIVTFCIFHRMSSIYFPYFNLSWNIKYDNMKSQLFSMICFVATTTQATSSAGDIIDAFYIDISDCPTFEVISTITELSLTSCAVQCWLSKKCSGFQHTDWSVYIVIGDCH